MVLSLLCTFVAHITFLHVFFLLPPFHSLSLSLAFSFSLSLFLSLSLYLCPLFLSVVARHMSSDALYQIFSSWSILLFHTISFHSSYKIHQLFTDYLLRLPSSELLEKHLFRSRANRRLVVIRDGLAMFGKFGKSNRNGMFFSPAFTVKIPANFLHRIHPPAAQQVAPRRTRSGHQRGAKDVRGSTSRPRGRIIGIYWDIYIYVCMCMCIYIYSFNMYIYM